MQQNTDLTTNTKLSVQFIARKTLWLWPELTALCQKIISLSLGIILVLKTCFLQSVGRQSCSLGVLDFLIVQQKVNSMNKFVSILVRAQNLVSDLFCLINGQYFFQRS